MLNPIAMIVSLTLGGALFFLIWTMFRYPVASMPPVHRRIATAVGAGERRTLFERKTLAPIMHLMLSMARRMNVLSLRQFVHRQLNAAGNPNGYGVDEYLAICLFSGFSMGVAGAMLGLALFDIMHPLMVIATAAIGFAIPLLVLRGNADARLMRISKQLPYSLDLISLMMAAGATFTEAVETVIRDAPEEDFNHELRIVLAEVDFGTRRAAALRNLAERIPLDSLRSIVGAIVQAETLGTPLAAILQSQSDILRLHRSIRAEKLSASASLRILVPTMLLLIAAVLFLMGPTLIRYMQGTLM